MKINYLGIILCIIILFSGFSSGCVTATKSPEALDIKQLADDFSSLQRDYDILLDENKFLHKLATAAVKIILEEEATQDHLISLAQTQWEYDIRIYEVSKDGVMILDNSKSLNSLEIVEVNKNFIIGLGERWSLLEILPSHIHQLGSLKDSYVDHMQIISPVAYDIMRTDGGSVHGEQYHFTDVPAGTEIKLVLTPELQKRIDHPSGNITIKVR